MKIFDMFASNGSTYFDKQYFNKYVIKNDIREGVFSICNGMQYIKIEPNTKFDLLNYVNYDNKFLLYCGKFDMVYADPPHLINKSGVINEKYTSLNKLNYLTQIKNMIINASHLTNRWFILKWNDKDVHINKVIEIAKEFFFVIFGTRTRANTYWILMEVK